MLGLDWPDGVPQSPLLLLEYLFASLEPLTNRLVCPRFWHRELRNPCADLSDSYNPSRTQSQVRTSLFLSSMPSVYGSAASADLETPEWGHRVCSARYSSVL